jgi:PAS domain S-box-containing protein
LTLEKNPDTAPTNEMLGGLFDAAPFPMMLCAIEDSSALHLNRRAIELFAGERNDGHMINLADILGKESTEAFLRRLNSGGFIDDFEVMLETSYGEPYCGTVSGQIVTVSGRRCVLVGMNDITDRKQAEETLRRFFDGAPLAMLLVRFRDRRVIRINRRASELFAQGGNEAEPLESHLGEEHSQRFLTELGEGGFVDAFECRLATGWGESFWANLSGQIIEINGERCVLAGISDITDRKRAEEEMRKAKDEAELATIAKSQFLATMSHEIRTPMNGVLGMLGVLATTTMSQEQMEMLSVVQDSARTLLAIIDDILDLSKVEAGKMTLESTPLTIRQTVATSVDLVVPAARGKGVEVVWRVDPTLPEVFLGDPTRLRQVLLNLLSNAVKFTDQGRVIVRVVPQEGNVLFEVEDSGIGMTEEQQNRLFQPFSQADSTTTRRFGGTGLGLAICKRLVGLMGGKIALRSVPEKGSVFSFAIPLAIAPQQPSPPKTNVLGGLYIMVADAVAESRGYLGDALRMHGAEVIEVADLADATAAMAGHRPIGAVLIDEAFDPAPFVAPADPPAVILLSAHGAGICGGAFAEEWNRLGLSALAKPMRWSGLVSVVAASVGRGLPDVTADAKAADRPRSAEAEAAAGRFILVAEDNPTNRIVIAKQLDHLGFAYDMVEDGEAAWSALARKSYALLLTDCRMPKLDGYALASRVRAAEKDGERRLPIIALTANALFGENEKCFAAGMDDYLAKPVALDNLSAALLRWLPETSVAVENGPINGPDDAPVENAAETPKADILPAPLDLAALAELLGDDSPETLSAVLSSFLEFFPGLLDAARTAIERRDREALHNSAHAAKGASRSACAKELSTIFLDLEEKSLSRISFRRLGDILDTADQAYAKVEAFAIRRNATL